MEVIERDEEFRIRLRSGDNLFAGELSRLVESSQGTSGARGDGGVSGVGVVLIVTYGGPGLADHTKLFPGLQRALVECCWDRSCDPSGGGGVFYGGVTLVIFYDQLGCGWSGNPPKGNKCSLASYVDELDQVVMDKADR